MGVTPSFELPVLRAVLTGQMGEHSLRRRSTLRVVDGDVDSVLHEAAARQPKRWSRAGSAAIRGASASRRIGEQPHRARRGFGPPPRRHRRPDQRSLDQVERFRIEVVPTLLVEGLRRATNRLADRVELQRELAKWLV